MQLGTVITMGDDLTDPTTELPENETDDAETTELPIEADPVDVVEQHIEVPLDREDER